MRTSVKQQAILLREARTALGVTRNADVYPAIMAIKMAVNEFLGGGMISHYRGNTWGVTWCGTDARDCFVSFDADQFTLSPSVFVDTVVRPAHARWYPVK